MAAIVAVAVALAWVIPARAQDYPSPAAQPKSLNEAITLAQSALSDAQSHGAADAAVLSLQRVRLDKAREITELLRRPSSDATSAAVALAQLATAAQAASLGIELPDAPPVVRHDLPSEAVAALLGTYGLSPDPDDTTRMGAYDDLPPPVRSALTAVVDNFVAFRLATVAALSPAVESLDAPDPVAPDFAALFAARTNLLASVKHLSDALATNRTAAAQVAAIQLPPGGDDDLGVISVDLSLAANDYNRDFILAIDAGGADTYHNNAGGRHRPSGPGTTPCTDLVPDTIAIAGSPTADRAASIITTDALVDLGLEGDEYGNPLSPRTCGANGGGNFGAGFLFDGGGGDTYSAAGLNTATTALVPTTRGDGGTNGGGFAGAGFVVDAGGSDHYNAGGSGANGGGFRGGAGMLVNSGLDTDTYSATGIGVNGGGARTLGSGFAGLGGIGGSGVLVDAGGDDRYLAHQGGVNGGGMASGRGMLVDGGGVDSYESSLGSSCPSARDCVGTNGGAGLFSAGLLVDALGSDIFMGLGNGVNGGAFGAGGTGVLIDGEGSDDYVVERGHDPTTNAFVDVTGVNGGSPSGSGVLVDVLGDDCYKAKGRGSVNGGGAASAPSFNLVMATAMLVDGGGHDTYWEDVAEGRKVDDPQPPQSTPNKGFFGAQTDLGPTPDPLPPPPCDALGPPPTTSTTSTSTSTTSTSTTSTSTTSTSTTSTSSTSTSSTTTSSTTLPRGASAVCSSAKPVADSVSAAISPVTSTITTSSTTTTTMVAPPPPPNDRAAWVHEPRGQHPPTRYAATMAPDNTGRVVMFGGRVSTDSSSPDTRLDDTWTWDGSVWTRQCPSASPGRRSDAVMAYHPRSGTVVLFGGTGLLPHTSATGDVQADLAGNAFIEGDLNDTWVWDGTRWQDVTPEAGDSPCRRSERSACVSPPARRSAGLAEDANGNLVLFGGFRRARPVGNTSEKRYDDTWIWDGTTWQPAHPTTPPPRFGDDAPGFAYHPLTGKTIVVVSDGGANQTWSWDGETGDWASLEAEPAPPVGSKPEMAYHAGLGRVVLFGGDRVTWTFDGSRWFEHDPANHPPGRCRTCRNGLAYHAATGRVVVTPPTANQNGSHNLGDTWTWDGRTDGTLPQIPPDPPDLTEEVSLRFDKEPPVIPADGRSRIGAIGRVTVGGNPKEGQDLEFHNYNGLVTFDPPVCTTGPDGECRVEAIADTIPDDKKIVMVARGIRPGGESEDVEKLAIFTETEVDCSQIDPPPQWPAERWWGTLDPTFGCHGTMLKKLPVNSAYSVTMDMVLQEDKIVVLTQTNHVTRLIRFWPDGRLDHSFGQGGFVTVPELSARLAVQPHDQKVVVVSYPSSRQPVLARFNEDGTPDNGVAGEDADPSDRFGMDGTVTESILYQPVSIAIQAVANESRILVGGSGGLLRRFTMTGAPDADFGPNRDGTVTLRFGEASSTASGLIAFQRSSEHPDRDRIIVAGTLTIDGRTRLHVVARLLPEDGRLDPSFNPCPGTGNQPATPDQSLCNGKATQPAASRTTDVEVAPNGRIVVVDNLFNLRSFNPDGTVDREFNACGAPQPCRGGVETVLTEALGAFGRAPGDYSDALALQPDGKILVVGTSNDEPGNNEADRGGQRGPDQYFTVMRFNPDGTLDDDCGTPAVVRTVMGLRGLAVAAAVQPSDGRILVAGSSYIGDWQVPPGQGKREIDHAIALVRYEGGGPSSFASVGAGDVAVAEPPSGSATARFGVTLDRPVCRAATVDYRTGDGTASAGQDYAPAAGSVAFAPGEVAKTVDVAVMGDTRPEPTEDFAVELSNPRMETPDDVDPGDVSSGDVGSGDAPNDANWVSPEAPARLRPSSIKVGDGTGVATISDAGPAVTVSDTSVTEPTTGSVPATFTISLNGATDHDVVVPYATGDGTATAATGDYSSTSDTVTIPAGYVSATVAVPVAADAEAEDTERFFLRLSPATGATVTDSEGVATIFDARPPPPPADPVLTVGDVALSEGDADLPATFTVSLDRPAPGPVSVSYATTDDSARAPGDYAAATGVVTFARDQQSATVSVSVTGDRAPEPTETFHLDLSGPTGATLGRARGTATVADDDRVGLAPADVSVSEAAGTAAVAITLTAPAPDPVVVDYATAEATARSGEDYRPTAGTVTFAPGQTRHDVTVAVLDDALPEDTETFALTVRPTAPPAYLDVLRPAGTVTVFDDDSLALDSRRSSLPPAPISPLLALSPLPVLPPAPLPPGPPAVGGPSALPGPPGLAGPRGVLPTLPPVLPSASPVPPAQAQATQPQTQAQNQTQTQTQSQVQQQAQAAAQAAFMAQRERQAEAARALTDRRDANPEGYLATARRSAESPNPAMAWLGSVMALGLGLAFRRGGRQREAAVARARQRDFRRRPRR